jgi:hypothetical protein
MVATIGGGAVTSFVADGGASSLVIGGNASLTQSWGHGASCFGLDSGLQTRLDGWPKNKPA